MKNVAGHRVDRIRDLTEQGDYCVKYIGDEIESVWFSMPGFPSNHWNRVNGPASVEKVKWRVTEDAEGRVTIDPSIKSEWVWGDHQDHATFHAYLKEGVWEILDDTIGANFDG